MGAFGGLSVSYAEHKTQTCAFYVIQRADTHTPTHEQVCKLSNGAGEVCVRGWGGVNLA